MGGLKFTFLLIFIWFFDVGKPDLVSDKAALVHLRSAIGGKTYKWNVNDSTPCNWLGVVCEKNRVTVLRLPADEVMGVLPMGVFGNLTQLRTLSLRLNALTGKLPADLEKCIELRNLYLQDNKFSGEIPEFLFKLHNLVRLNLARNGFSGGLSPEVNKLKRLGTLFLENNMISGEIPAIDLPNLVQFNVSNNQMNGSIPMKLRGMKSNSFEGNALCGGPLGLCPGERIPSSPGVEAGEKGKKKKLSGGAIAGIAIGSVLGFVLIMLILFFLCRKRSSRKTRAVDISAVKQLPTDTEKSNDDERNVGGGGGGGYTAPAVVAAASAVAAAKPDGKKKLLFFGNADRFFDLEDLLRASAEVLGKGTFGTAYKAVLELGQIVAVKRLKDVTIPEKEFREKIEIVGSMDHENLVPLRAYYYSGDEKLLVYDYLAYGSLSALLHGNRGAGRTPLNWETRSGIALGSARGIEYLHSRGPNVSHGNIKSSNILLDSNYDAHVSDFGLAQLVGPASTPNRVAGYRAPEVTDIRKVSQKADVYSFGVLLLELLTGKAPAHAVLNEDGVDLPRWVQSVVREEWTAEVFDLELLRYQNIEEEMVQLLELGLDCTTQYPDKRPTITEVVRRIEEIRGPSAREEKDSQPDGIVDPDDEGPPK